MAQEEAPESWEPEGIDRVAKVRRHAAIAFAREGQHGVRPSFHSTIDRSGEMHAEERKHRIRHRINQVSNEAGALSVEAPVLTSKWDDASRRPFASKPRDPVGMQTRCVHQR